MTFFPSEKPGDNREFNVATASDVAIYLNGGSDGSKTSADDTATEKYTDIPSSAKSFALRSDKNIQIIGINGTTFTDPITLAVKSAEGALHIEKWDADIIFKIEIRVLTDDTNIKLRVR